jgi:superfamily I DNA/RNA helicase
MKVRRDVILNDDQKKASIFETRPVIITGPAGCGKSVVITEKLINIFENFKWSKDLKILVTTFNKGLISQLRYWLFELLDKKGKRYSFNQYVDINEGSGEIVLHGQFQISIKLMHFEILGKFIGDVKYRAFDEEFHKTYLKTEIENVKSEMSIGSSFDDVLNPEFLLEEYHRVIYGLSCPIILGDSAYQNIERTGRGDKRLNKNSQRRKAIHLILSRYKNWMGEGKPNGNSFTERRQTFLNVLESGKYNKHFDYLLVDEFQDCTQADFRTMNLLLKDVNNLIITGDLAQSVHIGQSCKVPRDGNMRNRSFHKLTGSYRLPYRISEALSPLSNKITEKSSDPEVTVGISPYKGAPPGSRPIIVHAPTNSLLADKILSIKNLYSIFNLDEITILEKDEDLKKELKSKDVKVDTSTILRLKGLEKSFVVWSLQAEIEFEDESLEFAYTIMTRTNCLLVIALTENSKPINVEKLQYLRNDRLIIWDADTKLKLDSLNLLKTQPTAKPLGDFVSKNILELLRRGTT